MQGICRLSRRWHQQFCHSPAFGPHQQCIQRFVPVRYLRQGRKPLPAHGQHAGRSNVDAVPRYAIDGILKPPEAELTPLADHDDLVVREFEQLGSDTSTRRLIDPTQGAGEEAEAVWEELQEVDKQLEIAKEGPFGPQSEFMKQLTPEDRERVRKMLDQEGYAPFSEEDALDLAEIDRLLEEDDVEAHQAEGLQVTLQIPRGQQTLVNHFNKALSEAKENDQDAHKSLVLWKWYLRCQQKVSGFARILPESVWRFLWDNQGQLDARPQHLISLAQTMQMNGEALDSYQQLDYIRALITNRQTADAIAMWESAHESLSTNTPLNHLTEFYEVGVSLYGTVGRPQRAWNIAKKALRKGVKPDILAGVIETWVQSRSAESAAKAMTVYLQLRSLLADNIDVELYNRISNALIDAKERSLALGVFKDTIMHTLGRDQESLSRYRQALGSLQSEADPELFEDRVNQASLHLLLTLPQEFNNKYFFASWIKRLLGEDRTEAAALVVELMYERNIKPDAIHLNGILGAWFRDGSKSATHRALSMAQAMVDARIGQYQDVVQNNPPRSPLDRNKFRKISSGLGYHSRSQSVSTARPVPAANLETFSILFNYYEEKQMWTELDRLRGTMSGPAGMSRPNTFIFNRWLAAELRLRAYNRFWQLYDFGCEGLDLRNVETFQLAWQARTTQLVTRASPFSAGDNKSHKRVFADLMDWSSGTNSKKRRIAKDDFTDSSFYLDIIRSFTQQLDLPAVICAMQGLYQKFGTLPDFAVVRQITLQVARIIAKVASGTPGIGRRRRLNTMAKAGPSTLQGVADIIETLEAEKKIELAETGMADPEELEDIESETYKKLRLDVMIDLLRQTIEKTRAESDTQSIDDKIAVAARHMHVET